MSEATPLIRAATNGRVEVVGMLLAAGADIAAADMDGWTPLHGAAAFSHGKVVQILLAAGADPAVKGNDGKTPIDLAGRKAIRGILENGGADAAAKRCAEIARDWHRKVRAGRGNHPRGPSL